MDTPIISLNMGKKEKVIDLKPKVEKISDNPTLAKLYYGNKELNVDRSKKFENKLSI